MVLLYYTFVAGISKKDRFVSTAIRAKGSAALPDTARPQPVAARNIMMNGLDAE
jgi:hypothetical protein